MHGKPMLMRKIAAKFCNPSKFLVDLCDALLPTLPLSFHPPPLSTNQDLLVSQRVVHPHVFVVAEGIGTFVVKQSPTLAAHDLPCVVWYGA